VRCLELQSQPIDLRNFDGEYPHADFTAIVPTQLYRALHGDERLLRHLQSAKAVLVGGAHLPRHLRDQAERLKITIVATYGMSETCGGCVYNGKPLDGIKIEINSKSLVRISGQSLASAYLNAEDEWQKSFDGTWFTTQDIGEYADGYLQILGRDDEIIISGGENVSLSAIDELLSLHFPDIEAAAFAVTDVEWGHALHLAIVGEIENSTLLIFLEKTLGVSAKPKKIHRVASIPRIGIGKVDRKALVELLHNE
jgi:O-succinylbenzoic acid--CoA ligase